MPTRIVLADELDEPDAIDRWARDPDSVLVLAGHIVDQDLIDRLREAEPRRLSRADFSGVTFDGDVSFTNAAFGDGNVYFDGADFGHGNVSFFGADFGHGNVSFFGADFGHGNVSFNRATFGNGSVSFDDADFGHGNVSFFGADFGNGDVSFDDAAFGHGNVSFFGAAFGNGDVSFDDAEFGDGNVSLRGCTLNVPLRLDDVDNLDLRLTVLEFGGHVTLRGSVNLANATVNRSLTLESSAPGDARASLDSLDEAWLQAPVIVGEGMSMERCSLRRVAGLDQLRILGAPFGRVDGSGRQVVVHDPDMPTHDPTSDKDADQAFLPLMPPRTLAALYRQLRVGLESTKNVPAASDFYYGEMEARRRAAGDEGRWAERRLLDTYWLVSGYGVRTLRPLMTWLVAICAATVIFQLGDGFSPYLGNKQELLGWGRTWLFALSSSASFLRPTGDVLAMEPDEQLTQIALRFVGPSMIALALLSIRNRVKR